MKWLFQIFTILLFFVSCQKTIQENNKSNSSSLSLQEEEKWNDKEYLDSLVQAELNSPVNKSMGFITHIASVDREFQFLVEEYGFEKTFNDWVSYEFNTVYKKENIEVSIQYEAAGFSFPFVTIKNTVLPYDENQQMTNRDMVKDFSEDIRQIIRERQKRINPKFIKPLKETGQNSLIDLTELTLDYIEFGQLEHNEYLKLSAKVVKDNLDKKLGVIGK